MSDNSSPSGQGSKKPDFMVELIKRVQAMAADELPKQYEAQWGKLLESLESANWGDRFTELLPQGLAIALAHWFVGQSLGPRERPGTPQPRSRVSEHDLAIEVDPIRIDFSIRPWLPVIGWSIVLGVALVVPASKSLQVRG